MKITLYDIRQDNMQHPVLIQEQESVYDAKALSDPQAIVTMLNAVFQADRQCEEHLYLVSLNAANEVMGVFDVSRGTQITTLVDTRAILLRCILTGAASFVLAHPHCSGKLEVSDSDMKSYKKCRDAAILMDIPMVDFIIIGKHGAYRSFRRDGLCDLKLSV